MKKKGLAILLVAFIICGVGFAYPSKGAVAMDNNLPTRLESKLTNFNLEGFVGKNIQDNIEKWQLEAIKDNPNIIEEIERAAKKQIDFNSMVTDFFGAKNHYKIELDEGNNGLLGKSVKFTYFKKDSNFGDVDFLINKDITVNTDCNGADEIWCYVNASDFGNQVVPMRLNFEEGEPISGIRESWMPKAEVSVYTIADGETIRKTRKTVAEGFIELDAGFKGWVCYPLDTNTFNKYWSSGNTNNKIDKNDIHQFMFNLRANDSCLDKSFYIDAFSIVGSSLTVREGVTTLPLEVSNIESKEFRQLWSVDYPENLTSYEGAVMPWYGEFPGKLLTGMVFSYKLTNNAELLKEINVIVDEIEDAQGVDGYLGTYINGRFCIGGDNWDLWNHYHIIYGLYNWYKVSDDIRAMTIAKKALDYIINYMQEKNNGSYVTVGGWEMNMAIGHAFSIIYNETREQRYLDACKQMLEKDWDRVGNWYAEINNGKEFYQTRLYRWEALHPISMLSVLYEATGEKKYFDAFEKIWFSIAKTDRHNTGAFSSGEGAKGTPYLSGAGAEIETCCTISWMALTNEYYQMSRNMYAVDELELSFFNGMLGSLMEDHKYVTYNTPMVGTQTNGYDGRKVSSQKDITFQWNSGSPEFNCCQANAARGIAQLSEWGIVSDDANMYLNYYGASKAQTLTPNGKAISVKQTTSYPKNGEITIELEDMTNEETFALNLRIPSWSKQSFVSINGGEKISVASGQYLQINRKWKNGDKIQLSLDMGVHFWVGEENFDGYTSAYYGPILLTLDQKTTPDKTMYNTYFEGKDFETLEVVDASEDNFWLYFNVKDRDGNIIKLVDFASCGKYVGEEPGNYYTWLKINSDDLYVMVADKNNPPVWNNMLRHNITVENTEILVSESIANGGKEVSFSVNVPKGKKIDKLVVSTNKGEIIYSINDGGYSFIMPASDTKISVTFMKDNKNGCGGADSKNIIGLLSFLSIGLFAVTKMKV